jgi:Kef-type K+ transport system membrane component KefB
MLELYFLLYRIPRMMTKLARERKRSALAWTFIAVGAWIGAELVVGVALGFFYAMGVELWGWPEQSPGFNFLMYFLALAAALISVTIVTRILSRQPIEEILPEPPPPPEFPIAESGNL